MAKVEALPPAELREPLMEGVAVGPPALETFRPLSPSSVLAIRQFHAARYAELGIHTASSIDPQTGTLVSEVEAPEITNASQWLYTLDTQGSINGCIRIIEPPAGDIRNLPILAKYEQQTKLGISPTIPPETVEVSAMVRSADSSAAPQGFVQLSLACTCLALELGYRHAVMGVVPPVAKLLQIVYGAETLPRIGKLETVVTLPSSDASPLQRQYFHPEGLKLIPLHYDLTTSVATALDHYDNNPSRSSRLRPVLELLLATLEWQNTTPHVTAIP